MPQLTRLIVRRPVDRFDYWLYRPRVPQLRAHHDADERRDQFAKARLSLEYG